MSAISVSPIKMDEVPKKDEKLKKKLFFLFCFHIVSWLCARRLLMVEGIAEALLLPVLTKIAGGCLKESAVTVLNADGLNFNAFLPLFGENRLGFPVAIMTDGDAPHIGASPSATAVGLKAKETDISNLMVEYSEITFEHELARSPKILPLMLDAFEILHPTNGKNLKETIDELTADDEKADAFLSEFLRNKTSKGRFAQELAELLEVSDMQADVVPHYIQKALKFLGVIETEVSDG